MMFCIFTKYSFICRWMRRLIFSPKCSPSNGKKNPLHFTDQRDGCLTFLFCTGSQDRGSWIQSQDRISQSWNCHNVKITPSVQMSFHILRPFPFSEWARCTSVFFLELLLFLGLHYAHSGGISHSAFARSSKGECQWRSSDIYTCKVASSKQKKWSYNCRRYLKDMLVSHCTDERKQCCTFSKWKCVFAPNGGSPLPSFFPTMWILSALGLDLYSRWNNIVSL